VRSCSFVRRRFCRRSPSPDPARLQFPLIGHRPYDLPQPAPPTKHRLAHHQPPRSARVLVRSGRVVPAGTHRLCSRSSVGPPFLRHHSYHFSSAPFQPNPTNLIINRPAATSLQLAVANGHSCFVGVFCNQRSQAYGTECGVTPVNLACSSTVGPRFHPPAFGLD